MKANEFVKKFGLDKTKYIINDYENGKYKDCCLDSGLINNLEKSWWDICVYDLKRLVESHELVKDYYGLTRAKEHAESNYTAPELKVALKQAIADVESCMEVL